MHCIDSTVDLWCQRKNENQKSLYSIEERVKGFVRIVNKLCRPLGQCQTFNMHTVSGLPWLSGEFFDFTCCKGNMHPAETVLPILNFDLFPGWCQVLHPLL